MRKRYYIYIFKCSDGSYYTGITSNLEKRLQEHQLGYESSWYTYRRRPVKPKFISELDNPRDAIGREKQIKGWTRKKKEALIAGDYNELARLSGSHGSPQLRSG